MGASGSRLGLARRQGSRPGAGVPLVPGETQVVQPRQFLLGGRGRHDPEVGTVLADHQHAGAVVVHGLRWAGQVHVPRGKGSAAFLIRDTVAVSDSWALRPAGSSITASTAAWCSQSCTGSSPMSRHRAPGSFSFSTMSVLGPPPQPDTLVLDQQDRYLAVGGVSDRPGEPPEGDRRRVARSVTPRVCRGMPSSASSGAVVYSPGEARAPAPHRGGRRRHRVAARGRT